MCQIDTVSRCKLLVFPWTIKVLTETISDYHLFWDYLRERKWPASRKDLSVVHKILCKLESWQVAMESWNVCLTSGVQWFHARSNPLNHRPRTERLVDTRFLCGGGPPQDSARWSPPPYCTTSHFNGTEIHPSYWTQLNIVSSSSRSFKVSLYGRFYSQDFVLCESDGWYAWSEEATWKTHVGGQY